jgi:hypothetical protein
MIYFNFSSSKCQKLNYLINLPLNQTCKKNFTRENYINSYKRISFVGRIYELELGIAIVLFKSAQELISEGNKLRLFNFTNNSYSDINLKNNEIVLDVVLLEKDKKSGLAYFIVLYQKNNYQYLGKYILNFYDI